jgi:YesN/AraC family two-component response regulator
MPELSGQELTERLRNIRPDLPAIICSGFSDSLPGKRATELNVEAFLVKPVSRQELGETIHRVLNGNESESASELDTKV